MARRFLIWMENEFQWLPPSAPRTRNPGRPKGTITRRPEKRDRSVYAIEERKRRCMRRVSYDEMRPSVARSQINSSAYQEQQEILRTQRKPEYQEWLRTGARPKERKRVSEIPVRKESHLRLVQLEQVRRKRPPV